MPYSGPDAPPTVLMRVLPAPLQDRGESGSGIGGSALDDPPAPVQGSHDRAESAVHVGAVIAVADGLVERRERSCLLVKAPGREAKPRFQSFLGRHP